MSANNDSSTLSFANIAFSPAQEREFSFTREYSLNSELDLEPDLPRSRFATSTPRTTIREGRRGIDLHPPRWERPIDYVDNARNGYQSTDNSQGYQFFNNRQFARRGIFSELRNRFESLISRSLSVVQRDSHPNSFSGIEFARAGDSADLINLSEIFPSSNSLASVNAGATIQPKQHKKEEKESPQTMGTLYRSELMVLVELIFTKEAAYECVGEVGKLGMVQFNDLNHAKNLFQRYFVRDTRRCEEVERKLRFLKLQIQECIPRIKLIVPPADDLDIPTLQDINLLEGKLDELEKTFVLVNKNEAALRRNLNEMTEFKFVLERVEDFFLVHMDEEAMNEIEYVQDEPFGMSYGGMTANDVPLTPLLTEEGGERENGWFIAGVLPRDKKGSFERVLWRACRRTALVRMSEHKLTLEDPVTLDPVEKCVFIVFFKGESLRQIIGQVCEGFRARQYPCPKSSKERQNSLFETVARIKDLSVVLDTTNEQRHTILSQNAEDLPVWCQKIYMQKAIYHTLNMCTVDTNGFLAAECWVPESELGNVLTALQRGLEMSGSDVSPVMNRIQTSRSPPTFNRTNKFTKVYQSIVDSYGIASYREVNPAPFTIITFPFLFAVMFGDAAHGLILFLTGLVFIIKEQQIIKRRSRDEIFNTFFGGRYIMLLMGIFSIYTGMIYNDAFAKSFNVFGSRWMNPYNRTEIDVWLAHTHKKDMSVILDPLTSYNGTCGPYPFGVDPVWNIADNRLSFLNSMKMKLSVILGVGQMTFGVLLSFLNFRFFKSKVDIFTNFIPQLIFLSCIFMYLCGQMIVKWIYFSVHSGEVLGQQYPGSSCAPSLLIGLINMFMFKERPAGYLDADGSPLPNCYLNQWYPNQAFIESILCTVAVLCVPIMLFGKPFFTWLDMRKARHNYSRCVTENGNGHEEAQLVVQNGASHHDDDHGGMGDIMVHQAIHTIEFVLGCVSHTASYLRLWALSLAHAQLSEVLWHMVLIAGMHIGEGGYFAGPIAYVIFMIFATMSLSILVMMEGLSAFLHALRLHWVEFQSKFYQGLGNAFHPFSIEDALESAHVQLETVEDS